MPDRERAFGPCCRACAVRRHCSTTHSNRQTSPDTHRLARASSSLHPTHTIPDRRVLRPGSRHTYRDHAVSGVFFFFYYLFLFSFVWLSLFFLAVFVPQSRHPHRSKATCRGRRFGRCRWRTSWQRPRRRATRRRWGFSWEPELKLTASTASDAPRCRSVSCSPTSAGLGGDGEVAFQITHAFLRPLRLSPGQLRSIKTRRLARLDVIVSQ